MRNSFTPIHMEGGDVLTKIMTTETTKKMKIKMTLNKQQLKNND